MTTPDERAAIRAFLLTLEGKNGLQIADAIEDYLAPYARRLEEALAALGRYGKHEKGSGCPVIFSDHFSDRLCTCGLAAALARLAPPPPRATQ